MISAEIPCPTNDPEGYKVITEYMLHGPCGKNAKYGPCTIEGKCTTRYPKAFYAQTMVDEDGYCNNSHFQVNYYSRKFHYSFLLFTFTIHFPKFFPKFDFCFMASSDKSFPWQIKSLTLIRSFS
jgi:hypothetical protein